MLFVSMYVNVCRMGEPFCVQEEVPYDSAGGGEMGEVFGG